MDQNNGKVELQNCPDFMFRRSKSRFEKLGYNFWSVSSRCKLELNKMAAALIDNGHMAYPSPIRAAAVLQNRRLDFS